MDDINPYRSPKSSSSNVSNADSLRFFPSLVPASLALGLTLLIWVVIASTLEELVGLRFSIVLWSFTLFLSSTFSVVAINRLWLATPNPFAFGFAFAAFAIVFAIAEGDTSNGTNYWNMTVVYGTLLAIPIFIFLLAQ